MVIAQCECIEQHATAAVVLEHAKLLEQATMSGLGIAHRQDHVGGAGAGHIGDVDDAHMAQESTHRLALRRQGAQFGSQAGAERGGEAHDGEQIARRHEGEGLRALGDEAHHFGNLLLAAFHESAGHERYARGLDLVEAYMALHRFTHDIGVHLAVALFLEETIHARITASGVRGYRDVRQH